MANDEQQEKIGDDIPCGSGKHADPNIEEENHNEGTWDQNPGKKDMPEEGWRDEGNGKQVGRPAIGCQLHDAEQCHATTVSIEGHTNSSVQEQRPRKGGQKVIPAVPQHDKVKECSHRPSREAGRAESMRRESQKTPRTKGTYVKEHRYVQGKELCFDTVNEEKSKMTHNDTGSSAPKRLKSVDN
ncbi:hypothetical protein ACSBR2_040760 [Camellia fascicularis]